MNSPFTLGSRVPGNALERGSRVPGNARERGSLVPGNALERGSLKNPHQGTRFPHQGTAFPLLVTYSARVPYKEIIGCQKCPLLILVLSKLSKNYVFTLVKGS